MTSSGIAIKWPAGTETGRRSILVALILAVLTASSAWLFMTTLENRPLWGDELLVAGFVLQPTVNEMLAAEPPVTPSLFLLTLRALTHAFGPNRELSFRLFSAICAVLVVPITYLVATQLTGSNMAGLLAAALVAMSEQMQHFAHEAKPYASDALFSLLIIYWAERALARKSGRSIAVYSLVLGVGLGFSHAAIFTTAAVGLRSFFELASAAARGGARRCLRDREVRGVALVVLATLIAGCAKIAFTLLSPEGPVRYWRRAHAFPTPDDDLVVFFWDRSRSLFDAYFESYFNWENGIPFGLAVIIVAKRWRLLWYFSLPLILTAIASCVEKYPFGVIRLYLFHLPLAFICLSAGPALILSKARLVPGWARAIAFVPILCLPAFAAHRRDYRFGKQVENTWKVRDHFRQNSRPGDVVLVTPRAAKKPYMIYFADSVADKDVKFTTDPNASGYQALVNAAIEQARRQNTQLWLLTYKSSAVERDTFLQPISTQCRQPWQARRGVMGAYLFDCTTSDVKPSAPL